MALFDQLARLTMGTNSDAMGQAVEEMVSQAIIRRKAHERRWFDNNFFDDGYHFRMVSRKTGKVVDHVNRSAGYVERAIPRASRQIRGVSNLLFAAEPYPVVYPKRISMSEFQGNPQAYEQAKEVAKQEARRKGIWLANDWESEQELSIKLLDMILKASKNSVAWLQVYSNTRKQKIKTDVFDAFDIVCFGELDDIDKLPFIAKTNSVDFKELVNNPQFSEEKRSKLTPDNKYATSEIKDAYMRARYGMKVNDKGHNTIILKETFMKEYLTENNWEQAVKMSQDTGAMEGKSKGDEIMRHIYSAGGVTLEDEYIDYDKYPFAEFRFEPGPLYQVPFIERFIPQNKSVDVIMTRLEKWINTMVVGIYQQRKGENFEVANFPGGQVVKYEQTPLAQMNVANPTQAPFAVVEMMNKFIEEQGASTSALNQIPSGVKSGVAIESVKSTEYANLKIPTLMLKRTIKRIAELMLERASKDILKPVEVSHIENGQPQYFDVIGERGYNLSQKMGINLPSDIITLSKDNKVEIQIEPGLGLTMEGKKQSMQQIIEFYLQLYQAGFVGAEAMALIVKRFTETLGYGSTEELMEAIENGITQGQMSQQQMKQMQVAVLQAMKDAGVVGPEMDKKLVMASKVGTLESMKEAGLIDKANQQEQMGISQKDIDDDYTKIYKDAAPDIRRQIEQKLGLQPSQQEAVSPSQADTAAKVHGMATNEAKTSLDAKAQDLQGIKNETDAKLKEQALKQKGATNGQTNSSAA